MKRTISISPELDERFRKFCDKYDLSREEAISKMLTYCELTIPVLKNRERNQIPIWIPKGGVVPNGVYDQVGEMTQTIITK